MGSKKDPKYNENIEIQQKVFQVNKLFLFFYFCFFLAVISWFQNSANLRIIFVARRIAILRKKMNVTKYDTNTQKKYNEK